MGITNPIRNAITAKLIQDMEDLVIVGDDEPVFGDVQMIYVQKPTVLPACGVRPIGLSVKDQDLSSDYLNYQYEISAYEFLESAGTNSEVKNRMDRLGDIEDAVINYISEIPNNLEYGVTGYHVMTTEINNTDYDIRETEQGILLFVFIEVSIQIYNPFIKE
jgi:hypothetical protein